MKRILISIACVLIIFSACHQKTLVHRPQGQGIRSNEKLAYQVDSAKKDLQQRILLSELKLKKYEGHTWQSGMAPPTAVSASEPVYYFQKSKNPPK
jgi:hypothetical protein